VAFAARLLHQDPALAQAQPQADHQVAVLQEDEVPCAAHRDQRVSQKDKIKQLLLLFLGRIFFFSFRLGPGSDASAKTFPDETTQETVQADSESESGGNPRRPPLQLRRCPSPRHQERLQEEQEGD
jgi:hypothetical protein